MSRRIATNLIAFGLLAAVLVVWALRSLAGFQDPVTFPVTASFESAPGLRVDYEVAYLGTSVGRITEIDLEPGEVIVSMEVREDAGVPAQVRADIRRRSAVGEPYIFLSPQEGADFEALLAAGDSIDETNTVLSYASLFSALDDLLGSVPPEDLNTLIGELATAVDGRGDDMRSIIADTEDITATFAEAGPAFESAVTQITELTAVLADNGEPIAASLGDLRELVGTLRTIGPGLDELAAEPTVLARTTDLLVDSEQSLGCMLRSLAAVTAGLDSQTLASLEVGIDRSPQLIEILDTVLVEHDDQTWIRLLGQGDDERDIDPYPEPIPVPEVTELPSCDEPSTEARAAVAEDEVTPPGGGQGGSAPGGAEAGGEADEDDVAQGAGEGPESSDRFLGTSGPWRTLAIAVLVLAAAVGAVVGWRLLQRRRAD